MRPEITPEMREAARAMGRIGGTRTSERHGSKFYKEIGRKGGLRVRELIRKAQQAEAESD